MKVSARLSLVLLLVISFSPFFLATPQPVQAADCLTDQTNDGVDETSAAMTIGSYGHGQTFRPAVINRLKTVRIFMRNFEVAQTFTLTVSDISSGTPVEIGSITGSRDPELFMGGTVNPNTWVLFTWEHGDGLDLVLDRRYAIYLESDGQAMWARTGADTYSRGVSVKWGSDDAADDFGFAICGSFVEEPASSTTTTTTTSSSSSVSSQASTSTSSSSESSTSSTTSSTSSSVDASMTVPSLTYIVQDGTQTQAPLTKEVTVDIEEELIVVGKATAGEKVTVMAGSKVLATATTGANGVWQVTIGFTTLENQSYSIQAYAQKTTGAKSATTVLFQVGVEGELTTANLISAPANDAGGSNALLIAGIVLVVLAAVGIIGFLILNKTRPAWFVKLMGGRLGAQTVATVETAAEPGPEVVKTEEPKS